jgi:hypothetical protein
VVISGTDDPQLSDSCAGLSISALTSTTRRAAYESSEGCH